MRHWGILAVLLLVLTGTALAQDGGTEYEYMSDFFSLAAQMESGGMRAELTLTLKNSGEAPVTALIRNIAWEGECADVSFALTAEPGKQDSRKTLWQKEALGSLTQVQVWADVTSAAGVTETAVLTLYPLGLERAQRRLLPETEERLAVMDNESAGVFLLRIPEKREADAALSFVFYTLNRTDEPLRLVLTAEDARGEALDPPAVMDLPPQTVDYTAGEIPADFLKEAGNTLYLRVRGYAAGSDAPVVEDVYEWNLLNPRPTVTLAPTQEPGPRRIGTVTIRKKGNVNVREEGNTGAKKVGSAKAGASYPCYGVADSGWFLIELEDGTRGYVTNQYATLTRK